MIVVDKQVIEGTARDASGPGWTGLGLLVKSDGMGFSMTETNWAVLLAISAAALTATFQLLARRGQVYGNAVTGVMIGVIVNLPLLIIATYSYWDPAWGNPWAITFLLFASRNEKSSQEGQEGETPGGDSTPPSN